MKNSIKIVAVSLALVATLVALPSLALAYNAPQLQTNMASNVQNNSATLNGNVFDFGGYGSATVWFQWGTDTNYANNNTSPVTQNYTGVFSQPIFNLSPNQTYHFRAVAQNGAGTTYSQDMQFTTSQGSSGQISVNAGPNLYLSPGQTAILQGSAYSYNGSYVIYSWTCTGGTLSNYSIAQPTYTAPIYATPATQTCTLTASNNLGQINSATTTIYLNYNSIGNGNLVMTKWVRNLSSGSINWSTSVSAAPSDILQFSLTVQAQNNQPVSNVTVQDILPANLIYNSNLIIDGIAAYGNIGQGINIGQISAGQTRTIIYQAQVAGPANFPYGQSTMVNSATASSFTMGNITARASATVYVNRSGLLGAATNVSTGLTNNWLIDSFFLPLLLLIAGIWLWKSKLPRLLLTKK